MAASFRAYQNAVVGLNYINFVDESVDVTVTGRKIYLMLDNGEYLVPSGTTTSYIDWPTSSPSPFQVDVLDKDYSIQISVEFTITDVVDNTLLINGSFALLINSSNALLIN